jgi:hypothetical protein
VPVQEQAGWVALYGRRPVALAAERMMPADLRAILGLLRALPAPAESESGYGISHVGSLSGYTSFCAWASDQLNREIAKRSQHDDGVQALRSSGRPHATPEPFEGSGEDWRSYEFDPRGPWVATFLRASSLPRYSVRGTQAVCPTIALALEKFYGTPREEMPDARRARLAREAACERQRHEQEATAARERAAEERRQQREAAIEHVAELVYGTPTPEDVERARSLVSTLTTLLATT